MRALTLGCGVEIPSPGWPFCVPEPQVPCLQSGDDSPDLTVIALRTGRMIRAFVHSTNIY